MIWLNVKKNIVIGDSSIYIYTFIIGQRVFLKMGFPGRRGDQKSSAVALCVGAVP